ncbi:hypothetical protein KZ843_37205, partial [Pseudomonas aeruginosa]
MDKDKVLLVLHGKQAGNEEAVSYTHLRAHETCADLVCRLLIEKKKKKNTHDDRNALTPPRRGAGTVVATET